MLSYIMDPVDISRIQYFDGSGYISASSFLGQIRNAFEFVGLSIYSARRRWMMVIKEKVTGWAAIGLERDEKIRLILESPKPTTEDVVTIIKFLLTRFPGLAPDHMAPRYSLLRTKTTPQAEDTLIEYQKRGFLAIQKLRIHDLHTRLDERPTEEQNYICIFYRVFVNELPFPALKARLLVVGKLEEFQTFKEFFEHVQCTKLDIDEGI